MNQKIKAAAVQLATKIADSNANIASCERLALQAVREGAHWIALPEFFNTGVSWNKEIARAIQPSDGEAARFLRDFSGRHQVVIGGSFLCRIPDGRVRNRYQLYVNGRLLGFHDKDLPTMWENAFYEGGDSNDTGFLGTYDNIRIGAAVCWEFMRTMSARRLRHKVDIIIGGSCWWSIPTNFPSFIQKAWEPDNHHNALAAIQDNARLIGVPVIHAAHCGEVRCPMPGLPIEYRGFFEGHAAIIDARGQILAHRDTHEGEGFVCAELLPEAQPVQLEIPQRYWLRNRGILPTFAWHYQRWFGRRWYKHHIRGKEESVIC